MKLIVITHPQQVPNEAHAIHALFGAGMQLLHVRKPEFSEHQMEMWLIRIEKQYHPYLVLHNHPYLVAKYKLAGIHITRYNRLDAHDVEYKDIKKSISTHSLNEVMNLTKVFSYAFLSPVFESISKQGYRSNFVMSELRSYLSQPHAIDVIALGGIDASHIDEVRNLGFDGVALLGVLWLPFVNDSNVTALVQRFATIDNLCKL